MEEVVTNAEELAQDGTEESSTSTDTSSETDADAVKDEESAASADQTEKGQDGKEAEASEPGKKTAEDRIKQLVAKQRESEREAAYWRGKAEASKPVEPEQKATVTGDDPKPSESQFEDYNDYLDARSRWNARQEFKAERERQSKATEETKKAEAEKSFADKLRTAADKHEDFREVVFAPNLPVTRHMLEVMQGSEIGADILYHLGKNPDEAARISRLDPLGAAREIGKLEMKLSAPPPAKVPEGKRVTSAPPPVNTLAGNGTATVDPSKMSDADWWAHHKAEKLKQIQANQRR